MKKAVLLLLVIGVAVVWISFDLGQYFTLEAIKSQQQRLQELYQAQPLEVLLAFALAYIVMAAVAIPGGALLTLLAGAVFGVWVGTLVVSFASSIGATLAMLMSRTLLHDWVADRFRPTYERINAGIDRDGAFYLFSLRLVTYLPFFAINLAMGLTRMPLWRYYWVSQLGMLPGTFVFAYAGLKLGSIREVSDVLSADFAWAFVLLAAFPWVARASLNVIAAGKAYRGWRRPRSFDRNLVVIGGGAAGLVSAYVAAAAKAKVTLIEAEKMGGDCLNTGCVPSKTLIRSARLAHEASRGNEFGLKLVSYGTDFPRVMRRVHQVIEDIAPNDSVERYTRLGVECLSGRARITSPWTVQVGGRTLSTRNIIIATGGRPKLPHIPGLQGSGYLTSETVWQLQRQPKHLVVLGGGPIGCELAQAFRRLGSEVTLVESLDHILPREDRDVAAHVREALEREGVRVRCGWRVVGVEVREGERFLDCAPSGGEGGHLRVSGDELLVAVGRDGNTVGLGLEDLGLRVDDNGTVRTNDFLQTRLPNIYACGDIAGPYQYTHVAAHQAWYAAVNALFGFARKFRVDYSAIPFVVFTDPQVARVGLNETEAKERRIRYAVTRFDLADLDRAVTEGDSHGFIKVLTAPGRSRILGATVIGSHAAELISEYVLAIKHGLSLDDILGTVHAYPTWMEANKQVAGAWRREHMPRGLLRIAERFHRWRLG